MRHHAWVSGHGRPAFVPLAALVAAAAAALLISPVASAIDGDYLGLVLDSRVFKGQPLDVAVRGSLAFVGLDSGLQALNVSDVANPTELDHLYLPGPVRGVFIDASGTLVLAACGEAGLYTIDASSPSFLAVRGHLPTSGTEAVCAEGAYAYLAEASDPGLQVYGLRVVNVSNPANPTSVSFLTLPNGAQGVAVSSGRAYVAIGTDVSKPHGLSIIDVSNPSAPATLGFFATSFPVQDVAVSGTTAFLGEGTGAVGKVTAVNASVPGSPAEIGFYSLNDAVRHLSLDGTTLGVAAGLSGLYVLNAADPSAMSLSARYDRIAADTESVWVAGGYAHTGLRGYSVVPGGYNIIRIGPPGVALIGALTYSEAVGARGEAATAYLLLRNGLHVMDSTDPTALVELGAWEPSNLNLTSLDVENGLAAVGEDGTLVHLVDVTNPASPTLQGDAVLQVGVAVKPVLEGNTLYVVNGRGYEAFDISSPASPVSLGVYAPGDGADLCVIGSTGYLVSGSQLQILDLAVPAFPTVVGTYQGSGLFFSVKVSGGTAVLAGLGRALLLLNVSDPTFPMVMSEIGGDDGYDITLVGAGYAFVAAGPAGVLGFDISDPYAPTPAGFYDTSGFAQDIFSVGSTIYAATEASQHWVFDCPYCASALCSIDAAVGPPGPVTVCQGKTAFLDGGATTQTGCPAGLSYQWYEDGTPISGAVNATYTVPATKTPATYIYTLEATCPAVTGCSDTADVTVSVVADSWPTVLRNSFRASRVPVDVHFQWQLSAGSGGYNVHRTDTASDIPSLYGDPTSIIGTTTATFLEVTDAPPAGQVYFYQVYGKASCTGDSRP